MKELEATIGYQFRDPKLLELALTHSSYAHEHFSGKNQDNERLEFLGDAVLELVSSDYLYRHHEKYPEGELTKLRASIVCEPSLALCAETISLGRYLKLGRGEEATGGRNRASITSDAMEALIGAVYLDGGFANAKEFVTKFILNDLETKQLFYDSKTILQEIVQRDFSETLSYELVSEEGPDHDKKFKVRAKIGTKVYGEGVGHTKKSAQQIAAYQTILQLRSR
ncbi:MAG: ribonuclease III [Lachnospiraceae bacterium]|nr:ribonuclease III [Lachnospiraceae bacterium]